MKLLTEIDTRTEKATELQNAKERVKYYGDKARSENTLSAYAHSFELFSRYCSERGHSPYANEPFILASYITHEADRGMSVSTINLRIASIGYQLKMKGEKLSLTDPVKEVLNGIKRSIGVGKGKAAITVSNLLEIIDCIRASNLKPTQKDRDSLIFLLGFSSAMRRSELVALDAKDISFNDNGTATVFLNKSKTDQTGIGRSIPLIKSSNPRYCPISALQCWSDHIDGKGPLVRRIHRGGKISTNRLSGDSLSWRIKHWVAKIGLNPDEYGGHSLRSGCITACIDGGASIPKIKTISGHKSSNILLGYYRDSEIFENHAMSGVL